MTRSDMKTFGEAAKVALKDPRAAAAMVVGIKDTMAVAAWTSVRPPVMQHISGTLVKGYILKEI